MFCDYEELVKHDSNWVKSTIQAWEKALKKSLTVTQLLGKRPMNAFVTDLSATSALTSQQKFRRILSLRYLVGFCHFLSLIAQVSTVYRYKIYF